MTELEDLKVQVRRMQAMLEVHVHLMAALFGHSENLKEIISTFDNLYLANRDLMYFGEFSDQEINDSATAYNFVSDYLSKTESWLNSK